MTLRSFVAALCFLTAPAWAADPVAPLVNQIGQLPVRVSGPLELKFAIVEPTPSVSATANAVLSGSAVGQLNLTQAGAGYSKAPTVTITGGGGTGARATATVMNGQLTGLTVVAGGRNYTTPPTVLIAPPPISNAVQSLWSNDLTSVRGSEPAAAVTLNVVRGSFAALLGYTGIPNMAALPRSVFASTQARVRIWYRSRSRFSVVTIDAPLQAVPYSDEATYAEMSGNLPAGSVATAQLADAAITANKVADGSISLAKLAPDAVAAFGSAINLTGSIQPSDASLLSKGFRRVQTIPAADWTINPASGSPNPRQRHTAVWTGASLLVWGGEVGLQLSNQGGTYLPASNTWSILNTLNAPSARSNHTAVWTGAQMIVWGGADASGVVDTGGIYDPVEQLWRATAAPGAPVGRTGHTAVWAGDRMIVWGGRRPSGTLDSGASFAPPASLLPPGPAGAWAELPTAGVPSARQGHSAIWTGTLMIVFGGLDANFTPLGDGAAFNPATGAWTPIATVNAPTARFAHTAVWTGTKMIVFGGATSDVVANVGNLASTGAIYDPATNEWTALTASAAPELRFRHGAVWTGSEMLVFGGEGPANESVLSGAAFSPATNSWRSLPVLPGATATGVWSGQSLLTFGLSGLGVLDPSPTIYLYGKF